MKNIFKPGDQKFYKRTVQPEDIAAFHGEAVHRVCSTFALARDMEWTTRLFVLEMRDEDEEGVGTFISIEHRSPAFVGEQIDFTGTVEEIRGHELVCSCEAHVGGRVIARGKTGQKIFRREKIRQLFNPG